MEKLTKNDIKTEKSTKNEIKSITTITTIVSQLSYHNYRNSTSNYRNTIAIVKISSIVTNNRYTHMPKLLA